MTPGPRTRSRCLRGGSRVFGACGHVPLALGGTAMGPLLPFLAHCWGNVYVGVLGVTLCGRLTFRIGALGQEFGPLGAVAALAPVA